MASDIEFIRNNKSSTLPTEGDFWGNALAVIGGIFWVVVILIVLWLILNLIRLAFYYYDNKSNEKKMVFLQVSLPRTLPEEAEKENGRKQENEVISMSENIFQVMSYYSRTYFLSDWFRGAPSFSCEIVKAKNKINFFLGCPPECVETIEKQIISTFAKCKISILPSLDFHEGMHGSVIELVQKKPMELPFRTYSMLSGDPMNNIINALELAKDEEVMAFQMVISPVSAWWQAKGRNAAHKLQNEKDKGKVAAQTGASNPNSFEKADENAQMSGYLTPNQQNMIKRLEEKAARPGYRFALRIAGFSKDKKRAEQLAKNFLPAFKVFDIEPFNGFMQRRFFLSEPWVDFFRFFTYNQLRDFVLRKPAMSNKAILNVEEISSLWHLPNFMIASPSIDWMLSYKPTIPTTLIPDPAYGVKIGEADGGYFSQPVYQSNEDRTRHSYVLGGSGSGKSVFMINIMLQNIKDGHGLCVVDPHGEAIDDLLLRMPKERMEDVIILSPAFVDAPLGLNVLWTDPTKPEQKTIVINNLFSIWNKLYDMQSAGGPQFEYYMKNAARLVMGHPESGNTLMEISKIFSDKKFRDFKIAMCTEPDVADFWLNQASKARGEHSLENMTTYITSKLAPFITNDFIRPMIGQCDNSINFRQAMDNKKIVLVKLEKGLIGEMSMYLIGMVIISNILLAGMGRSDGKKYNEDGTMEDIVAMDRTPFFVYIDEMQNFLFDAIPQALEEIRKYKVGFTLAHQFVKQIVEKGDERIKDSIMANTGSKFIFNCGIDDAEYLEKEFKPTLNARDLMNPERFTCNARIMISGQKTQPFNLKVAPLPAEIDKSNMQFLVEQSKLIYGTPIAEVIKDMEERVKINFEV
jgi:Helicase HerA, central domain/TraM recognition site of TraD and TraG